MQSVQPKTLGIMYIGIIAVVIGIAVAIIYIFKKNVPPTTFFKGPFFLSKNESIVEASDFSSLDESTRFLTAGNGSFQAFVYLDTLSKTGTYIGCGTDSNKPNCDSGLYGVCTCTSISNCDNCKHDGYKNVVSLYGVYRLEILNVPDASRQNAVSTQLVVKTTSPTSSGVNSIFVETIALPPLPMQKWVMITITNDGRRVVVYYNDGMVSSSTLENTIYTKSFDLTYVKAGDDSLSGTIGLLRFYSNSLSTSQVSSMYASLVDTRGSPIELSTDASKITAAISVPTAGSLLSRLSIDGLRAPSVTIPQISDALSVADIYGNSSQRGSISALYTLNSPYA
jgi:hypothetical protein